MDGKPNIGGPPQILGSERGAGQRGTAPGPLETPSGHSGRQRGSRSGSRSGRRDHRASKALVSALTVAAAVGAGFAGCHPTGSDGLDVAYSAIFAAVVTLGASRAARAALLFFAAVTVVMSRQWLLIPAGAAMFVAFGSVFGRRSYQRLGALIGALGVQVILRWPPVGFHGATALIATVAVAPVLVSAWRRQRRRTRRMILVGAASVAGLAALFTALVALGGLLARHPAEAGLSDARSALHGIAGTDSRASIDQLDAAASSLATAHSRSAAWWTLPGRLVPLVAQQQKAMSAATAAGEKLTAAAAGEASRVDVGALRYQADGVDIDAVRALAGPLGSLDAQIASAQRDLAGTGSPWLVEPIASRLTYLKGELTKASRSATLATEAVKAAPGILGGDGVRHYFVAFTTPAETRGLGGFIGAYAELEANDGRITMTRSGQIGDLDTVLKKGSPTITAAPTYMARYGRFDPASHFQDLTYSPDLPTVAKVIGEMYPQAGGSPIDGVLVLDPQALDALLKITGPVTVPGLPQPLTAANADDVLLRRQYEDFTPATQGTRRDLLQAALEPTFSKLTGGSLPEPQQMAELLSPEVRQGHLLFWSNHPSEQPFLETSGLAGAFPQPGPSSDLLAVTVSNGANNKIDAYLHESIADQVHYDPRTGHVSAQVTITFKNSAPPSGLPPYVLGSYAGSGLPPGTNLLWMSLYSPLTADSASADGQVIGFSPATEELGTNAYSTFLTIGPQSTKTVVVNLDGTVNPGPQYRMTLRLQPLAYPVAASVSVQPAAGSRLRDVPSRWSAGLGMDQPHTWSVTKG